MNNELIMNLIQEISEVQAAGNYVHLMYTNFSIDVYVMHGEIEEGKKWDETFHFSRRFSEKRNEKKYKQCLEYLSKMKETV